MSGSFIDSGTVLARVQRVGADNYVARINNEAKYVKKVNSEIMEALNAIVRFASIIMLPLGLALFASSVHEGYAAWAAGEGGGASVAAWLLGGHAAWEQVRAATLSCVGALLGMNRPGARPAHLIGPRHRDDSPRAPQGARPAAVLHQGRFARVDVLCLDKTGTITSGRMEVEGTYPIALSGGEGEARGGVASTWRRSTSPSQASRAPRRAMRTRPARRCSPTTRIPGGGGPDRARHPVLV